MRIGISKWEERISPVFDVSKRLLIVDIEPNRKISRFEKNLPAPDFLGRIGYIAELGIQILICGAVSRPLEEMLISAGIRVIPQTCGLVEDVLQAFLAGRLHERMFSMPGCFGKRHRFHGRHGQRRGRA